MAHRRSFDVTLGLALFERLALIVLGLSFANRQGHFHFALLPVKRQRQQSIAFDRGEAKEPADFRSVQEQLPDSFGLVVGQIPMGIFVYVGIIEIDLLIPNAGESIADLPLACSQ